jgi:hypothetical protein
MFSDEPLSPAGGKMTMTPSTKPFICPHTVWGRLDYPAVQPEITKRQQYLWYVVRSLLLRLQGKHTLTYR